MRWHIYFWAAFFITIFPLSVNSAEISQNEPVLTPWMNIMIEQDANNKIKAIDTTAGEKIWEFPLNTLQLKATKIQESHDKKRIFYGWGSYLFEIDRLSGRIIARIYLGDNIKRIQPLPDKGIRTILSSVDSFHYERTYKEGKIIEPVYDNFYSQLNQEAVIGCPKIFTEAIGPIKLPNLSYEDPSEIIKVFKTLIEKDPTNPWFYFCIGQFYLKQNNTKDAELYFSKAYMKCNNSASEHLYLGIAYDTLLQYAWADKEFEKAYSIFMRKGYIPELNITLVSPIIFLKKVANEHLKADRKERFINLINWIKKFGPYGESEYYFNLLYAEWLKKNDMHREAEKILSENKNVSKYSGIIGGWVYIPIIIDQCIIFIILSAYIFLFLKICFSIRYRKQKQKDLAKIGIKSRKDKMKNIRTCLKYSKITYLKRREKIIFIIIYLSLLSFLLVSLSGIGSMGNFIGSLPVVLRGNFWHPIAIKHFEDSVKDSKTKGSLYTLAYAYQMEGRYDDAISIYQRLLNTSQKAKSNNNLGVIYQIRNDPDNALREYSLALNTGEDLVSPYYNLSFLKKDPSLYEKAKKLAHLQIMLQE